MDNFSKDELEIIKTALIYHKNDLLDSRQNGRQGEYRRYAFPIIEKLIKSIDKEVR